MRSIAGLVVLALGVSALGQGPKDLDAYLSAHPWNVTANGPLLVMEPEKAHPKGPAGSFAAFDRKVVKLGGITALVPRMMIEIDESLRQIPNMYEGLPTEAKVLYLLRSLSDDQWRKVGTTGVGLSDLQGEQRLVLESLLPRPFAWHSYRVSPNGMWGPDGPSGTLTEDDREGVKLKVERSISLRVFLRDGRGETVFGNDRYRGKAGDLCYERKRDGEFVQKSAFGVDIRKEVPNTLKPSQLDYRSSNLNRSLTVPPKTTVGGILQMVNSACGLEIIPDFRVAERGIDFRGGQASASDLLQALALSVEGTYRRVGSAFVLSSDLAGMGARKYRLACWQQALQTETWKRSDEWRTEIGARGGFANVRFDSKSAVSPSDQLVDLIDKADQSYRPNEIGAGELTPALRKFLDQWDFEYTQQPIRKDKVGLSSDYIYRFMLPNGTALMPEGGIGPGGSFKTHPPAGQQFRGEMPKAPLEMSANVKLAFLASAEDAPTAAAMVQMIAKLPGSRLWLDTHNQAALKSALQSGQATGVEIGLALRPWRIASDDPDRNIGGESGQQVLTRLPSLAQGPRSPDLSDSIGTWIAPSSPVVAQVWQRCSELASTPGLYGVVLLETQPFGYEPERAEWQSSFGPLEWASVCHGYTVQQRLAFLRLEQVDPIDIGDSGYWTTPDLRQAYFFDDGLRGMPSVYDGTDDTHPKTREVAKRWREFLAKGNQKAIEQLLSMMGEKPIFIEQRLANINSLKYRTGMIAAWKPGTPLPQMPGTTGMSNEEFGEGYYRSILGENPLTPDSALPLRMLYYAFKNPDQLHGLALMIDLERIPTSKLPSVLDAWFKPAPKQ